VPSSDTLRAAYFRQTLHDWMTRLKRPAVTASAPATGPAPDAATCAQLAALGYVDVRCRR
jgi:hypothetical protein